MTHQPTLNTMHAACRAIASVCAAGGAGPTCAQTMTHQFTLNMMHAAYREIASVCAAGGACRACGAWWCCRRATWRRRCSGSSPGCARPWGCASRWRPRRRPWPRRLPRPLAATLRLPAQACTHALTVILYYTTGLQCLLMMLCWGGRAAGLPQL